ncbi:MAG: S41 family peptidase [Terricaulis sp.]
MRKEWRTLIAAMCLMCGLAGPPAHAQMSTPSNLGFEDGPAGGAPAGWSVDVRGGGAAVVSAEAAHSGALGAEVRFPNEGGAGASARLSTRADAAPYRGRRVLVSGMIANTGGGSGGYLWIQVLGAEGEVLAMGGTESDAVMPSDWTRYAAAVPVADDAVAILFGYRMRQAGVARIDDIALADIGPADEGNAPPRPLSARGLENVTAFARLYGYVRYFHPSDEAAHADWDTFLCVGIERVENARTDRALRDALRDLFAPLAPGVGVTLQSEPEPALEALSGDLIAWHHRGLGGGRWGGRAITMYGSQRATQVGGIPPSAWVDLPRGLVAHVPLVVARDAQGRTLPLAAARAVARSAPPYWTPSGDDRTSRLAAVIEAWNIAQHFAPTLETQGVDWAGQLSTSLAQAARDDGAAAFDVTMRRMALALRDAHASAARIGPPGEAPFAWEWIENSLVVTAVAEGVDTVRPGDVVLAIDGRAIGSLIAEAVPPYGGATEEHLRFNALSMEILKRNVGAHATLSIERGGQRLDADVAFVAAARVEQPRPAPIAELEPGVLYVDLTRLTRPELAANLDRMAGAPAIVFDVRGYPTDAAIQVLPHLADHNVQSDQFNTPLYTQPDRQGVFYIPGGWNLPPAPPRFGGAFVFLTDERATSYGESIMSVVERSALGPIVGAHTSGTNGDINGMVLLTGHSFSWTGMQVIRADGSRRFGVGVPPTIPAHRTIAGVRAGHDEMLEAAVAAVRPGR